MVAPIVAAAGIGAAGSVLGGLIGSSGAERQNKRQIALSREQMAFQERMSSTAYQRASVDLEKAGLNRILALGSPASTPGGAMAPLVNELAPLGEGVGSAVQAAQQVRQTNATIKQIKQNTNVAKEDEALRRAQQAGAFAQIEKDLATARQARATAKNLENVGNVSDRAIDFLDASKPVSDYILGGDLGRDAGKGAAYLKNYISNSWGKWKDQTFPKPKNQKKRYGRNKR